MDPCVISDATAYPQRVRPRRQYTLPYLDVCEAPVMAFDRTGSKTPYILTVYRSCNDAPSMCV